MSDVSLNTFPATKTDALAMLYVQKQDISGLTPEELLDKYVEAYDKIRERSLEINKARRSSNWVF